MAGTAVTSRTSTLFPASYGQRSLVAAYLRLSREDGDKAESNSITNQRNLIRDYLETHGMQCAEEYVDDGYSGTDFNRPAFSRLVEDCKQRKINCIVVKDLSRLGRNYIETGRYLEKIFPLLGVRFIAVTDRYDSFESDSGSDDIIVPFKNLINDAYCRDISIKIRSQLDLKRRNGEFIGSFAGYGYVKDPEDHNHLIIDEPAANIVRLIFSLKLDGMNQQAIADRLNSIQAETPFERKRNLGYCYNPGFCTIGDPVWTPATVSRILKNEVYIGTVVQGKVRKINYKIKKNVFIDEDDWIRVEGKHDPIVSKELFGYVQDLLKRDTRTSPDQEVLYLFSGFVKCGDCGQNMNRRPGSAHGKEYFYYKCSEYVHNGTCTSHCISEKKLTKAVTEAIRMKVEELLEITEFLEEADRMPGKRHAVTVIDTQIKALLEETARFRNLKTHLYQDKVEGLISLEEYTEMDRRFSEKLTAAEDAIEKLQEKRAAVLSEELLLMPWLESIRQYRNIRELSRKVLVALVDRIDVFEGHRMEVHFRFEQEVRELLEMAQSTADEEDTTVKIGTGTATVTSITTEAIPTTQIGETEA